MMTYIRKTPAILAIILSGCAVGPEYIEPTIQFPRQISKTTLNNNNPNKDITKIAWWKAFNDTQLNQLVEISLKQNLTILQAIERINSAKEQLIVAKSNYLPSLQTSISSEMTSQSNKLPEGVGKLEASWMIDLFGRNNRILESVQANIGSIHAVADMAKLTIISSLLPAYIDARYFQERIHIARKILTVRKQNLDLIRLKFSAGAASKLDVIKAETLVNTIKSEIPNLEKSFLTAVHSISKIIDSPAKNILSYMQKKNNLRQPNLSTIPNIIITADMIRNRPDVRHNERQLADAVAKIGIAKADLYPSISLNGFIDYSHVRDKNWTFDNKQWVFGPKLQLSLLTRGKTKANVHIAESHAYERYLAWRENVLNAINQVENSLVSVYEDKKTVIAMQTQVNNYKKALSLSMSSYQEGASSLLEVANAQHDISAEEINLAAAKRQLAKSYIDLHIAIGSGYNFKQ
ncbi:efflux transporter outer membrane subunit [Candidatus Liberibacter sp.]|uniref:efflux transporter outer membrane subunit n=1 Tax=Candidatus Liberibacter sp. TaxID=34022 RepID=UPI0015F3C251|nr:efflux transporter outer membrane subunit [Candidatus Liberibacter sp.]MBA5724586.1 efflux transporter outer membrane subunit [Candidatus Liberibacter sp.]